MADSQSSMVSIVGIIAILILVGLAAYFIIDREDNDLEVDIGQSSRDVPVQVIEKSALAPPQLGIFSA